MRGNYYCRVSLYAISNQRLCFESSSLTVLLSDLEIAGKKKNNDQIMKLWKYAEDEQLDEDTNCKRSFLKWFSSLGYIQQTIDIIGKLLPDITAQDTLCLMRSYQMARDHEHATQAMQLLLKVLKH